MRIEVMWYKTVTCAAVTLFIINYMMRFRELYNDIEDQSSALDRGQDKRPSVEKLLLYVPLEQKVEDAGEHAKQQRRKEKRGDHQSMLFPESSLFTKWGRNLSHDEQREAQAGFNKYGYNVYLSDRLPTNRQLPDTRDPRCATKVYPEQLPSLSVVLIYLNEALSVIKRAIHSIIHRTPDHLLKELILVDDHSTIVSLRKQDLGESLDFYIATTQKQHPQLKILRVRHDRQMGLAQARVSGWSAASADVVAILDIHIEVNVMWAEPLLAQIKADRTVVVSPVFDRVNYDDFEVVLYQPYAHGFDWALWCTYVFFSPEWYKHNDGSTPGKSPSVMGILVADRAFLGEIGSLDAGMDVYGGENVELGIRTCGGSIEVVPCSKIAHIERAHKPYAPDLRKYMMRNALRVADIWMDEYKYHVHIAWNLPLKVSTLG
ncbi:probable polypeptide N-acetylgalactosaminyltransferase 8 [Tachysurus ichikawai]